ncbi:MAG: hypothetical protein K0R18_463 [Bacillales bacterium]|jgi:hypothetical protein|nr:hypothetical protein [Bacillales bacterium]
MNPYIKSSERTNLPKNQEAVNQPLGIDYSQLLGSMSKLDKIADERKTSLEKKSALEGKLVKDLRKTSNNESISKELEKTDLINDIQKSSIIPVPGLKIEYENSGSQDRPPDSDFIAPHGPVWSQ